MPQSDMEPKNIHVTQRARPPEPTLQWAGRCRVFVWSALALDWLDQLCPPPATRNSRSSAFEGWSFGIRKIRVSPDDFTLQPIQKTPMQAVPCANGADRPAFCSFFLFGAERRDLPSRPREPKDSTDKEARSICSGKGAPMRVYSRSTTCAWQGTLDDLPDGEKNKKPKQVSQPFSTTKPLQNRAKKTRGFLVTLLPWIAFGFPLATCYLWGPSSPEVLWSLVAWIGLAGWFASLWFCEHELANLGHPFGYLGPPGAWDLQHDPLGTP